MIIAKTEQKESREGHGHRPQKTVRGNAPGEDCFAWNAFRRDLSLVTSSHVEDQKGHL